MKEKVVIVATLLVVAVVSFFAGRGNTPSSPSTSDRHILYYVDPMHPSYRSEKPGTAPDCGMALEPVYSDENPAEKLFLPPGAVAISAERQQLAGVSIETVGRSPAKRLVRTTGRIAMDENRLYRVLAATDGWIRTLHNNAAGTVVHKDETLATFYSNDFLTAQQSYFFALKTVDRLTANNREVDDQVRQAEAQVHTNEEALRSLGMGEPQIRELSKSRIVTRDITIASPADGIVLARNLSPNQRLEHGAEMYRIANLDRVWILADVFPNDALKVQPGTRVRVSTREMARTFCATVSANLPIFDSDSRTLKLRLEAPNPGLALRPDMFVDLEFQVSGNAEISVPADAVLDSGLQKIVYVETSEGVFEPRQIEVGAAYGDRLGIKRGLQEGDRVVTAGNFLIDSESRMRSSSLLTTASKANDDHDPVFGMKLDAPKARASGRVEQYLGDTYLFCSDRCQTDFRQDPGRFVHTVKRASGIAGRPIHHDD